MEQWRDIIGYEGLYRVSSSGKILSLPRVDSIGRKREQRIMKPTRNSAGYYIVELFSHSIGKVYGVHQLVAVAFLPNENKLPCVNHINSNRTDNNVGNLEWCTWSHNNRHAHTHGAQQQYYGEKHHQSKLTKVQVVEIRRKYQPKVYSIGKLAFEYNVSSSAIQSIIERKTWKGIL